MEFFVVALIFISCMIALALLIYYCQEKRDPRYGINENQRAITSIALSIGAPELIFKDEKKSSKLQKPIMYNKNALIFLDELSDSDTSDKIYYPPKSAAYAVARRTSMSSAQPRSISVTPHQAMEALQYFNNRRRSLGALSQTNNSTVQDANIVNKREAKKIPTFNTIHAKLSEDENEYTSSISSDVSEQNVLPMLSIENLEEKDPLKWSKGSAKDLTMETNVQTEMPSIRKKLSEDLTPPKIVLPKQQQRTVSLENRLPLISQTTNFERNAPVERLSLQSVYPPGFLPVQQGGNYYANAPIGNGVTTSSAGTVTAAYDHSRKKYPTHHRHSYTSPPYPTSPSHPLPQSPPPYPTFPLHPLPHTPMCSQTFTTPCFPFLGLIRQHLIHRRQYITNLIQEILKAVTDILLQIQHCHLIRKLRQEAF